MRKFREQRSGVLEKTTAESQIDHRLTCDSDEVTVIVHLSDIHFGAHSAELGESLLSDVAAQQPDVVVVSGDLTQRARPTQFEQALAFVNGLPKPVLTVVGNHDLPLFNLPSRLLSSSRRYEHHITSDLDPVLNVPGLIVVGLDTMPAWRWKDGHVSPRQVDILRDAFGNAPSSIWRILVTHHPVLPVELSGLVGARSSLTPALRRVQPCCYPATRMYLPWTSFPSGAPTSGPPWRWCRARR